MEGVPEAAWVVRPAPELKPEALKAGTGVPRLWGQWLAVLQPARGLDTSLAGFKIHPTGRARLFGWVSKRTVVLIHFVPCNLSCWRLADA